MNKALTLKEIYRHLYITEMARLQLPSKTEYCVMEDDKASRLANIYAVKNTVKVWRKQ